MGQLFDADGKLKDRDGLRNIHLGPRSSLPRPVVDSDGTRHVPIRHEQDGGIAGVAHESADGNRRDVDIFGRSATAGSNAGRR